MMVVNSLIFPYIVFNIFLQQDVLDSKNSAIKDLQYELARVCKVS